MGDKSIRYSVFCKNLYVLEINFRFFTVCRFFGVLFCFFPALEKTAKLSNCL